MENITTMELIALISIILTAISIIIHLCVLRALKSATNKSITEKIDGVITQLGGTVGKLLKALNLDGVSDAMHLIKDIITDASTPAGGLENTADKNE